MPQMPCGNGGKESEKAGTCIFKARLQFVSKNLSFKGTVPYESSSHAHIAIHLPNCCLFSFSLLPIINNICFHSSSFPAVEVVEFPL